MFLQVKGIWLRYEDPLMLEIDLRAIAHVIRTFRQAAGFALLTGQSRPCAGRGARSADGAVRAGTTVADRWRAMSTASQSR
jgi:hypothetical protein